MDPATIIALIMAIIGYFTAKSSGADDTEALAAGALVGAGTYYVGTQTEWGISAVESIDGAWTALFESDGVTPAVDANGDPLMGPPGSTVSTINGVSTIASLGQSAGGVLESWGAAGTAAVIGTTALATSDGWQQYIPWAIGAAVLLLVMR